MNRPAASRLGFLILAAVLVPAPSLAHAEGDPALAIGSSLPRFQPGDDLSPLLRSEATRFLRVGLNGAPPAAYGELPAAPATEGLHWLVLYDRDGAVLRWQRFLVGSATGAEPVLRLPIDTRPPAMRIDWSGPLIDRPEGVIVGPAAVPVPWAEDASGLAAPASLQVDGSPVDPPADWARGRAEGRYRLSLHAEDSLGNAAIGAPVDVLLDRTPPTLHWERSDPPDGLPAEVFDGRPLRLRLRLLDAAAGVARLQIGDHAHDFDAAAEAGLDLVVDAGSLDYTLVDAVGNQASGRLPLQVDDEGPRVQLQADGELLDLSAARLRRSATFVMQAIDEPAGVARACVELSIWYDECRPLPLTLVGIAPGRYVLKFRAMDRLGNRSQQRIPLEVLP